MTKNITTNLKLDSNRIYGKSYSQRHSQPCMFQILSWPQQPQIQDKKINHNITNNKDEQLPQLSTPYNPQKYTVQHNINNKSNSKNQGKIHNDIKTKSIKLNQQYQSEYTNQQNTNYGEIIHQNQDEEEQNHENKLVTNCSRFDGDYCPKKSILKPHQIQSTVYYYEDSEQKRYKTQVSAPKDNLNVLKTSKGQKGNTKLDATKMPDKKIIQQRKKVISSFRQNTRQLPNSSFVTYYGKPAFQLYGYLTSEKDKKTHNVMPHCSENRPKSCQSHQGALVRGKSIAHEQRIPRMPLVNPQHISSQYQLQKKGSHNQRIQIPKPDLVNNVRFTSREEMNINVKNGCGMKKQQIPSHVTYYKAPMNKNQKKNKSKNQLKRTMSTDDGLAYFNTGRGSLLLQQIKQKKMRENRLPYKVTECYPIQPENPYGVNQVAGFQRSKDSWSAKQIIYGHSGN